MKNEDILKAAQNEKKGREYEGKQSQKSGLVGSLSALIVALMLIVIEYGIKGTINLGIAAVGMTGAGADNLYEGIKNRKIPKIVLGAAELLFAVMFILAFIGQVKNI